MEAEVSKFFGRRPREGGDPATLLVYVRKALGSRLRGNDDPIFYRHEDR